MAAEPGHLSKIKNELSCAIFMRIECRNPRFDIFFRYRAMGKKPFFLVAFCETISLTLKVLYLGLPNSPILC